MSVVYRKVSRPVASILSFAATLSFLAFDAGAQTSEQLAALAVDSPDVSCLTEATLAPSVRIVACTVALESATGTTKAAAHVQRGQAYRATGDAARAAADFEAAIRLFDSETDTSKLDAQYFISRATARHSVGDLARAISDYSAAIHRETARERGDAQPASLTVPSGSPADREQSLARSYANRGMARAGQKADIQEAIADFSKSLELVPSNVDVLLLRADAYLSVSQAGAAKADAERAAALSPENPRVHLMRGLIAARQGNVGAAFADYSEAIRLAPDYVDALANRGALLSASGDYDNALHDLDAALAVQPRHTIAAYNRGYVRFAQKKYAEAIADYSLALQSQPTLAWALANRGLCRILDGQPAAQATADADEAVKLLPDNSDIRETRAYILLKGGNSAAALADYELALRADAKRPVALFGRGLARQARGDAAGAKADLAAARILLPTVDREFEGLATAGAAARPAPRNPQRK